MTGWEEAGEAERVRASEARLVELLPKVKGARRLCLSVGRAQLAVAAARGEGERRITAPFLDLHLADRAREALDHAAAGDPEIAGRIAVECVADLPEGPFDVAMVPLLAGGDSELAWELLQQAYVRLVDGGSLFVSVNEPRDRWVAGRMEALFGSRMRRWGGEEAIAYSAVKRGPLKKEKQFLAEFAFRDRDRLIQLVSRPGVFSHRSLDLGARALIESLNEEGGREHVAAGARVLDLGCGSGAVGFAAALRAAEVTVLAIDSMPRALDCVRLGAGKNGLAERVATKLDAAGRIDEPGTFDLVLGNPPYYSRHAIAEIFVAAALRALKPGGRAHFVTRQPDWFVERMQRHLDAVRTRTLRTYAVVSGVRKKR